MKEVGGIAWPENVLLLDARLALETTALTQ